MHNPARAHYVEAERLLAWATANPARVGVALVIARAGVHAQLATLAALCPAVTLAGNGLATAEPDGLGPRLTPIGKAPSDTREAP